MACKHCETVPGSGECMYPWYGVAPHKHDLSKTGTFLGSTVMSPKTEWPANFKPDPEDEGLGVYTHCLHCGDGQKRRES